MRPFIRRGKELFKCSICDRHGDDIVQSPYTFKQKNVCTTCANTMRFNVLGNYTVIDNKITETYTR